MKNEILKGHFEAMGGIERKEEFTLSVNVFRVGSRVKIKPDSKFYKDRIGTIISWAPSDKYPYTVKIDSGSECRYSSEDFVYPELFPSPPSNDQELIQALEIIANWTLPDTGKFWPDGEPTSYETEFGSNGARDFMKNIAQEALNKYKK